MALFNPLRISCFKAYGVKKKMFHKLIAQVDALVCALYKLFWCSVDTVWSNAFLRAMSMQDTTMTIGALPSHDFEQEYRSFHPSLMSDRLNNIPRDECRRFTQLVEIPRASRSAPPPPMRGCADEPEDSPHEPFVTDTVRIPISISIPLQEQSMCCTIHEKHMGLVMAAAKLDTKDVSKCVIRRVLLNSVSGLTDPRWELCIRDGAPLKKHQKSLIGNAQAYIRDGCETRLIGFPIPNFSNASGPTVVYDTGGVVDDDIERYGSFTIEKLIDRVLELPDRSGDGQRQVLVPAYPNGMYFFYALVTKSNGSMKNMGMKVKEFDGERYICMPSHEYAMVVNAYKEKLRKIEEKMHNLSKLEISVKPLTDCIRVSENEEIFLSLTIECDMPDLR
jgi:hypothetical protein